LNNKYCRYHKMKNINKYNTVRTVLKSKRKLVKRGKIDNPNTLIHHLPLAWYRPFNKKVAGLKLVVWAKASHVTEMLLKFRLSSNIVHKKGHSL